VLYILCSWIVLIKCFVFILPKIEKLIYGNSYIEKCVERLSERFFPLRNGTFYDARPRKAVCAIFIRSILSFKHLMRKIRRDADVEIREFT